MKEKTKELWIKLFKAFGWGTLVYIIVFFIFFRWMFPHGDFVRVQWFIMSAIFPTAGSTVTGYVVLTSVVIFSMFLSNLVLKLITGIVKLIKRIRRRITYGHNKKSEG